MSPGSDDLKDPDTLYISELRNHRRDLITIQKEQTTSYDKAILTLSGGALGISIAFADKFGGNPPPVTHALLATWGSFSLAICFNILSHLFSSYDMGVEIEKVSASIQSGGAEIVSGNRWRQATHGANILAIIAFLAGVVCFSSHAYITTQSPSNRGIIHDARPESPTAPSDNSRSGSEGNG